MNIQEKLIQNYPLINKVDSELKCYVLDKKRYLVFWDELIKKDSIEEVINFKIWMYNWECGRFIGLVFDNLSYIPYYSNNLIFF